MKLLIEGRVIMAFSGGKCLSILSVITFGLLILIPYAAARADDRYLYPKQMSVSPKGVNLQTGRYAYSETDLSIGDLSFTRSWGDQPGFYVPGQRTFGIFQGYNRFIHGWNHTLNQGTRYKDGGSNGIRITVIVGGQSYEFGRLSSSPYPFIPQGRASNGTYLRLNGSNFVFTDKSGAIYNFIIHSAIDQEGNNGNFSQLLSQETRPDGTVLNYSYRSTGQLQEVRSTRGYAIHLDYDANNNLSKVCGYNLAQTYATATTVCGSTPSVTYGYDSSGQFLNSVTDLSGGVVGIQYYSFGMASAPSCITLANSSTCAITNVYGLSETQCCAAPDQIIRQTTATGDVWQYNYEPTEDPTDVPIVPGHPRWIYSTMVDPLGTSYAFKYDRGRLVNQEIPSGIINYKYPDTVITKAFNTTTITFEFMDTLPALVTMPSGDQQDFLYDPRGNVMYVSHWPVGSPDPVLLNGTAALSPDPDIRECCISPEILKEPTGAATIARAFMASYYAPYPWPVGCGAGEADAKLCDKPIMTLDELSNQTDYTYDPAHGGVLTETGPAVNGIRPQTRYTYVQRYAWMKNSSGGYVQASTPVWLLASKSFCKSGAASSSGTGCDAGSGDEVKTTYDYGPDSGPNNLLLRGQVDDATGDQLRTCYGYDWQGNRISETKPRAGLTSCP